MDLAERAEERRVGLGIWGKLILEASHESLVCDDQVIFLMCALIKRLKFSK